jgi:hypothetical protein
MKLLFFLVVIIINHFLICVNGTKLFTSINKEESKNKSGININNSDKYKFRLQLMKKLQNNHTWSQSPDERMDQHFNKDSALKGSILNPDEFIAYIGFLKDSSYKANNIIFERNKQNYQI